MGEAAVTRSRLLRGDTRGRPLSEQELASLVAYARFGWAQGAADEMGISAQTIKNYLSSAYHKLGAHSNVDAFHKLGWLRVSEDDDAIAASQLAGAIARLAEAVTEAAALLDQLRTSDQPRGATATAGGIPSRVDRPDLPASSPRAVA